MRLSTRLTMLGLSRTLKTLVQVHADAQETLRELPVDREATGRRLAARRARRAWETGEDDDRTGA